MCPRCTCAGGLSTGRFSHGSRHRTGLSAELAAGCGLREELHTACLSLSINLCRRVGQLVMMLFGVSPRHAATVWSMPRPATSFGYSRASAAEVLGEDRGRLGTSGQIVLGILGDRFDGCVGPGL